MANLGTATLSTDNGGYDLTLNIEAVGNTIVVNWTLSPPAGDELTGKVIVDFGDSAVNQFSIHIPTGLTGLALCLAGCVAKSLLGPVIECLSTSRDPKKVLACLQGKGISITSGALACALACLVSHPIQ